MCLLPSTYQTEEEAIPRAEKEEEEEEEEEEDESEYETDTDESEEGGLLSMPKPIFIPKVCVYIKD